MTRKYIHRLYQTRFLCTVSMKRVQILIVTDVAVVLFSVVFVVDVVDVLTVIASLSVRRRLVSAAVGLVVLPIEFWTARMLLRARFTND